MSFLERVDQTIRRSPVWRSLFRQPYPNDERSRAYAVMNNVFLHLHPVRVRQHAVKFAYTFCLGGLSFFLFLVLTVTGVYLMFFYIPSTTSAYTDILNIQASVAFGQITRNIHRWGAHLMVFFVFLHMMRVFYHGAYKPPREFNWVVGVLLLLMTIALSFTGYLLPWDQISYWAITIGLNMAGATPIINTPIQSLIFGGLEVGQNTLLRFYVLHIMVLPLVAAVFLAVHFWRIRKDGGISGPLEGPQSPASLAGGAPLPPRPEVSAMTDQKTGNESRVVLPVDPTRRTEIDKQRVPMSARPYRLLALVKQDAVVRVQKEPDDTVMTWPHLLSIEFLAAGVMSIFLLLMGLFINAPLEELANGNVTPAVAKAPWYFLGLQELLAYFHPVISGRARAVPVHPPRRDPAAVHRPREHRGEASVGAQDRGRAVQPAVRARPVRDLRGRVLPRARLLPRDAVPAVLRQLHQRPPFRTVTTDR